MVQIVVLDGGTLNPGDNPWSELEALGETQIFAQSAIWEIVPRAVDAEILVINKVRLDRAILSALPRLRMVAVTATGYDCVDISAARDLGISVCNVPVYGTDSVAQHVFALLLHVLHRIDIHDAAVREGEWQRRGDFSFWKTTLSELAGKTMGIIGFGRIGRRVGELAHAFGMRVIAQTRTVRDRPLYDPFAWVDARHLTAEADVISLHCPLTDQTRGFVNAEWLSRLRRSAILINAGRGALVVESDLAAALNRGELAAAAADVVSIEPMTDDNPLRTAKNCFVTPHLAWATLEARRRLMAVTADNVRQFLNGTPQRVV